MKSLYRSLPLWLPSAIVLLLFASGAFGQNVTINALPTGAAITGTESVPMYQSGSCSATSGTCQTTPAALLTYVNANAALNASALVNGTLLVGRMPALTGDVTTSAGAVATTIAASAVTNAKLANMAASSIKCNSTTGSAVTVDCNPLQAANLMAALLAVDVASNANTTLSGLQTVDGIPGFAGEVVLLWGQTTASQNGFYVMASGAWSRAVNFPGGYTIPQFCDLAVFVLKGTSTGGLHLYLDTSSAAITVGTTSQTWRFRALPVATPTVSGTTKTTSTTPGLNTVPSMTSPPSASGGAAQDCVSFSDTAGSIADSGDLAGELGPCIVSDANGHALLTGVALPASNVGTLDGNDQHGHITGLTAATSVTITFGAPWTYAPSCGASTSANTAVGMSASSTAAVTLNFVALTGSLHYWCF